MITNSSIPHATIPSSPSSAPETLVPITPRQFRLLTILAFALLLIHQLFYLQAIGWDAIDDAYISFRYALNFVQGHGLVFNTGEYVQGYTNFLWTILMALPIALHIPVGLASIVLGAICDWAILFFLVCWALPRQPSIAALAALLLAADGSFALWSVSGMETSCFTMFVVAGIFRYWYELEHATALPWSGFLLAIATLVRPEGGLVFAVTFLHAACWRCSTHSSPFNKRDILRVLLYTPPVLGYLLFSWLYYGSPLPNTFTDKVDVGSIAQAERGFELLGLFTLGHGAILLPIALTIGSLALLHRGEHLRVSHSLAIILPYTAYIVAVGGDWSVGRFFVPFMPFTYLLVAASLIPLSGILRQFWQRTCSSNLSTSRMDQRSLAISTVIAVLILLIGSSLLGEYTLFVRRFHVATIGAARIAMGHWLATHVPPHDTIAVDAAGQMAYYGGHYVIDLYGLNNAHIAKMNTSRIGHTLPGHEKFGLDYAIRAYHPNFIAIYGNILSAPVYRAQYQRLHVTWTNNPHLLRLLNVYRRRPPDGPRHCHFAPAFTAITTVLSSTIGACLDEATVDRHSGDLIQNTQHGLLVQAHTTRFVSFSDGYHTWIIGPFGLQERLNSERFFWEPNAHHLPVIYGR